MQSTVSAIILSAGSSHRMGQPKALLRINKMTFIHHIIECVESAGLQNNVIVLGFEPKKIQHSLVDFSGTVIVNDQWEQGQLTSIIAGINSITSKKCIGAMICPVDHPCITSELVKKLFEVSLQHKGMIIIPVYQGKRGHPVIVPSELFSEICSASLQVGLRQVIHAHEQEIITVPTDEQGILVNIDTPEDYQKYIGESLIDR